MSLPIHYCSYFDHRYLTRALSLYDSLVANSPAFTWHVLALSDACERMLLTLNLPYVKVTSLKEIESAQQELLDAKSNRSIIEYFFTLTSAYCVYVMKDLPEGHLLTYLDSDLYFFGSPVPVLEELSDASVGIIEHRFSQENSHLLRNGRFNVGWVSFRNDASGCACLADWYNKCLEWCYDRVEDYRFADQKYLDFWPEQFSSVRVIQHRGANVAPWNVAGIKLGELRTRKELQLSTDNGVLFYHFQGLRRVRARMYSTAFEHYHIPHGLRNDLARFIYRPYIAHLRAKEKMVEMACALELKQIEKDLRNVAGTPKASSRRERLLAPFMALKQIIRRELVIDV